MEDWIQKAIEEMGKNNKEKGTIGAFTKQAKRAKMSTDAFADEVLSNPSKFQQKTRKRAQFYKNMQKKYAKGGETKSFWDKTRDFGKKASEKAKEYGKKGVDATKQAIHDKKKRSAMNVLYETRKHRNGSVKEKNTLEMAEDIVAERYAKGGEIDDYVAITLVPKKTAYKGGKGEVYKNMQTFYDTINSNEDKYPFIHYLHITDSRKANPEDISEIRVYMLGEKSGFDDVEKRGLYDLFDLKKSKEEVKAYAEGGKVGAYKIDEVLRHFVNVALWSSTNDEDEPLEDEYDFDDIPKEELDKLRGGIKKFIEDNEELLQKYNITDQSVGHDLFLDSQGHGAGFWDRGYDKADGDELSESASKIFASDPPYAQDGKVYFSTVKYAEGGEIDSKIEIIRNELQSYMESEVRKVNDWSEDKNVEWEDIESDFYMGNISQDKHPKYNVTNEQVYSDSVDIDHYFSVNPHIIEYGGDNDELQTEKRLNQIISTYSGSTYAEGGVVESKFLVLWDDKTKDNLQTKYFKTKSEADIFHKKIKKDPNTVVASVDFEVYHDGELLTRKTLNYAKGGSVKTKYFTGHLSFLNW
jgi:hypothetical protein